MIAVLLVSNTLLIVLVLYLLLYEMALRLRAPFCFHTLIWSLIQFQLAGYEYCQNAGPPVLGYGTNKNKNKLSSFKIATRPAPKFTCQEG